MAQTIMFEGLVLSNVHDWQQCQTVSGAGEDLAPRDCVIHRPSGHHMRDFQLHWRSDRGIFERICQHGVGHPDPDQFAYWRERGTMAEAVHGCDGCCSQGPLMTRGDTHVV